MIYCFYKTDETRKKMYLLKNDRYLLPNLLLVEIVNYFKKTYFTQKK